MAKPEVLSIFDVNQLQPHKTQYACGYFATALCFAANEIGKPCKHDASWVIQSAFAWYAEDNGTYDISNHNGMKTIEQLYDLIKRKGGHYQAVEPKAEVIQQWLEAKYPIIVTVGESTVYDADLHRNPYTWESNGWNHIIVATGIDSGHIFYCRDTVNQNDGSPYRYDFDKMQLIHATVFVPEWMPLPTSTTPSKGEEEVIIDLNMPEVAHYFEAVPGNERQWKCKSTGRVIQYGILDFYRKYGSSGFCGLTHLGLPKSNELPVEKINPPTFAHFAGNGIVLQYFERGVLLYDPAHLVDNPLGSDAVYLAHLYQGPGQDPAVVVLQAKLVDALKAPSEAPADDKALIAVQQVKAIVAPF